MKLSAAVLVLCVVAAGVEPRAVSSGRSGRNLLTAAVSGVQNALGQAVGGALSLGGAVVGGVGQVVGGVASAAHQAIDSAEDAVVAGVGLVEQLAERLVQHNSFAVRILQCLAGAAVRKAESVAGSADSAVDAAAAAVNSSLHQRNLLLDAAGGVLWEAAGATRDCVVDSLQDSVSELQQAAHGLLGNASGVAEDALETLKEAIEKNVKGNATVLQALDGAVDVAEQVVRDFTQKADEAVDSAADQAEDALSSVSAKSSRRLARNAISDVVDQVKQAFAQNLAHWINNTAVAAEDNAEQLLAIIEKAADEALRKAHAAADDNLIEGSDWKEALDALLQNVDNAKENLAGKAEGAVDSALEGAEQIALGIVSKLFGSGAESAPSAA